MENRIGLQIVQYVDSKAVLLVNVHNDKVGYGIVYVINGRMNAAKRKDPDIFY